MKKLILLTIIGMVLPISSTAQLSQAARDSINKLSKKNHKIMMKKLGISELRPGPSGNPNAPNAANSDESKVPPYTLPDPLVFEDGSPVETPADWQRRRKELYELFNREVYGHVPNNVPSVSWEVESNKDTVEGKYTVTLKELVGQVDNSSYPEIEVNIQLRLTTPAETNEPVPVIMHYGFPQGFSFPRSGDGPTWKEQLLEKGWGYAVIVPTSYQADYGAGLRRGIIGLANKGKYRDPDDWGVLRSWAWGASRAIDYFETDPAVDNERIGIEGLSRYGKAAIVAMAYDQRIAIGFIGSSGAGGTKILRRDFGEQVENLASSAEYHWFAGNFIKYAGPLTRNDLPVDAHQLVALCAPRPVFISSGSREKEGTWVDAKGMFLSGVHASPVYELLGKEGLGTTEFPPTGTNLVDGDVAFRRHEGGHTNGPNWTYFIEFASRYFE